MKIHELKLQQPYFAHVHCGLKDFEVRKNDRGFGVGDRLKLIEYSDEQELTEVRFIIKEIKYILEGGQYGIASDYVVLGLKDI
jgi:hypothetical protein